MTSCAEIHQLTVTRDIARQTIFFIKLRQSQTWGGVVRRAWWLLFQFVFPKSGTRRSTYILHKFFRASFLQDG